MMRCSRYLLNVGICTKWIDAKGFGFVRDNETQKEYFVHFRQLNMATQGHRGLNVGQEVQFDCDETDVRPQAVNVCLVGGGGLPPFEHPDPQTYDNMRQQSQGVPRGQGFGNRGGHGRGGFSYNNSTNNNGGEGGSNNNNNNNNNNSRNYNNNNGNYNNNGNNYGRGGRGRGGYQGQGSRRGGFGHGQQLSSGNDF